MADCYLQILKDVKNGNCSIEEAQQKLSQLSTEQTKTVTYKVSPKGAISFYGLRRMPISLYQQELEQIVRIANTEEFKHFVCANHDKIAHKGQ